MADKIITPGLTDLASLSIASGDVLLAYGGVQQISAGTNLSTIDRLASVFLGPEAAVNFVSTLQCGTSGDFTVQQNSGKIQFKAACTGTGANTIARLNLQGNATLINEAGGTVTELNQQMGYLSIAEGTDLTTYRLDGGQATIEYDATAITTLFANGGSGTIRRPFTTATVTNGSSVVFAREVVTGTSSISGTTLNIYDGRVKWIGGAITTVNLYNASSMLDWYDMAESATIGTMNIHYAAQKAMGVVQGSNTTRTGKTLTITTVTTIGGKLADAGGYSPL